MVKPTLHAQALQSLVYVRNTGGLATVENFDEDFEPIGPALREQVMPAFVGVDETGHLQLTLAGLLELARADRMTLDIWVITFNPSDFPGMYVLRRQEMVPGIEGPVIDRDALVSKTIEPLRHRMRLQGLHNLGRDPNDDAVIVECWI